MQLFAKKLYYVQYTAVVEYKSVDTVVGKGAESMNHVFSTCLQSIGYRFESHLMLDFLFSFYYILCVHVYQLFSENYRQ